MSSWRCFSPPTCLLPEKILFAVKYWEIRNLPNGQTETEKGDLIVPRIQDWVTEPAKNRITNSILLDLTLLYFFVKNIIVFTNLTFLIVPGQVCLNPGESIQWKHLKEMPAWTWPRAWDPSICKDNILQMHREMWHGYFWGVIFPKENPWGMQISVRDMVETPHCEKQGAVVKNSWSSARNFIDMSGL